MFSRNCFFFTTLFCLVPGILFATGSDDESTPPQLVACAKSGPQLEKPLEKTSEAQPQSTPEAQPERARRKPAPVLSPLCYKNPAA